MKVIDNREHLPITVIYYLRMQFRMRSESLRTNLKKNLSPRKWLECGMHSLNE